ncbi:MAG: hypothetical protein WCP46_05125 [Alphaproteobacteria bacterium]
MSIVTDKVIRFPIHNLISRVIYGTLLTNKLLSVKISFIPIIPKQVSARLKYKVSSKLVFSTPYLVWLLSFISLYLLLMHVLIENVAAQCFIGIAT